MPTPDFRASYVVRSARLARLALQAGAGVLLCSLLAFGCSQDEGESCQTNRDCADGLICAQFDGPHSTCMKPENAPPPDDDDDDDEFPFDGGSDDDEPVDESDSGTDDDAGS